MAKKTITNTVVLKLTKRDHYWKLFSHLCKTLDCGDNKILLFLDCYKVSTEHAAYVEVVAHNPHSDSRLKLSIPHELVLLISEPSILDDNIGFRLSSAVDPAVISPETKT